MQDLIAEQIPRLRRYARALVGRRAAADDLVQDTLERAWARRHLWRRGTDLRAWLFTIMHNLYVNRLRARRDYEQPTTDHAAFELADAATSEGTLALRDLERGLERLAPEYREVLLLVGIEQMRYEEVAEMLRIPVGTVMSRLARGRERLRQFMAGQPATPLRRVK